MNPDEVQAYNRLKRTTPHERELPHRVLEDIWIWSTYDDEKDLHFNGYLLHTADGSIVIDPPSADELLFEALRALTVSHPVRLVIITNRDHERESHAFKVHFDVPVTAPETDAGLLSTRPDQTFRDGDMLPGGLSVIHLPNQKSPGESASYMASRRILFLGDALWGKPMQHLTMLSADKYEDVNKAKEGLRRLLELDVTYVLPGDGEPVMQNAKSLIEDAIR